MRGHILIVDDERSNCEMIEADLRLRDFRATWFTDAASALAALGRDEFDAVLTDLRMPVINGAELCTRITANRPDIPVIVMTAFGSLETAVAAIRVGAYDFVTKPIEMDLLAISLERAVRHHRLQQQVNRLSHAIEQSSQFEEILGASPAMQRLFDELSRIADTETTVLVTGESGTGKELVARAIHKRSRRNSRPFVAVNCAAIPETLLESELFGHAKGAFTDAHSDRKGLLLQAEQGTLFLDEIGELPMTMQVKLLRALEERTVRPVGGNQELPFDVRLIAATNRDLETSIEEDRFREDLLYRINVIHLHLPPLRARGTDVLLIAQQFLKVFAARSGKHVRGLSESIAERLLNYSWPGNVRELRNVIERAVALARYDQLSVDDLPEKIRQYQSQQVIIGGEDPLELVSLEELERRYIRHVLQTVGQNKTLASRILGLDRKTLYRKLLQHEDTAEHV
jgi:DNA-binding NtrC family response regulator